MEKFNDLLRTVEVLPNDETNDETKSTFQYRIMFSLETSGGRNIQI
jgi:hypothetical protein